ncbi:hypothetical protein BaRGS_00004894 [Batillaria attramentaria]|uniref:Uncharacterized protein n=1 Tax=Batillaria attramentaria TaxID=370345 RepID=A0ABD0LW76_9CAEN
MITPPQDPAARRRHFPPLTAAPSMQREIAGSHQISLGCDTGAEAIGGKPGEGKARYLGKILIEAGGASTGILYLEVWRACSAGKRGIRTLTLLVL